MSADAGERVRGVTEVQWAQGCPRAGLALPVVLLLSRGGTLEVISKMETLGYYEDEG